MTVPKKIAIVGTAWSWSSAPFGDTDWEIWAISGARASCPRWDVLLELHPWEDYKLGNPEGALVLRGLDARKPVYMQDVFPDVPASVRYPFAEIEAKYPPVALSGTMAYAAALAIEAGPSEKRIGLWGVHCDQDDEWKDQRAGLLVMQWIAEQRGISMTFAEQSPLSIPAAAYAFDGVSPAIKAGVQHLKMQRARKAQAEVQAKQLLDEAHRLEGAIASEVFYLKNLMGLPPDFFWMVDD